MQNASNVAANMAMSANGAVVEISQIPKVSKAAELGLKALSVAGNMLLGMAISWGVSKIVEGIDNWVNAEEKAAEKLEEMAQKAQEAKSNIESISSEMKSNIDTIDDVAERYAELAQGVDTLSNKNLTLSTGEYEEFLDLTNQLSEVFPQLNMGIDDNGNAILDLNGDVNTITSSLQTLLDVEKQLAQQEIADNAGEYIANTLPQLKASYEDLEEQRKQFERDKARYSSVLDINSIGYGRDTNTIDVEKNISSMSADSIKSVLAEMGINKDWEAVYSNDKYHTHLGYKMELSTEDKNTIEKFYGSFVAETERNIKKSEAELARANKELSLMANYWLDNELSLEGLDGKAIYGNLQSDELQAGIKQMLNNVDWASLQITEGWDSEDDVYDYINTNILAPLESVEPEIRDSVYNNVIKAFTDTTISSGQRLEILKNLQSQFDKLGIEIDLSFKINELESQNDIIKNRLGFNKNASNATDAKHNQEINEFVDYINHLPEEDKTIALEFSLESDKVEDEIETELKELQQGGTVNLLLRPQIDTSELNEKGWDAGEGIATVYSSTYSNEDGTVAMNFTPIIADPITGEYKGALTPDELQEYAEGVIAGTREDDLNLQIGTKFVGEDAISQAESEAEQIHQLHERYYNGLIGQFEYYKEQLQGIADDEPIVTHVELQTSADSMKSAFDDLQTALADYQENGLDDLDISNLTKLGDENTFGNINGSTAAYERFLAVMQDIDATEDEVQNAFDELATTYIYNSDLADKINESNKEWIALQLEKNGITNSAAVAEQMLINKLGTEESAIRACINANLSLNGTKITSANASDVLENATLSEIIALADEAQQAGDTSTALINYAFDKMNSSKTTITTDGDISNLLALCEALDIANKYIKQYNTLKKAINDMESAGVTGATLENAYKSLYSLEARIQSAVKTGTKANTDYSGGFSSSSSGSGGSGSGEEIEETSETFDHIETKTNRLEEAINRLDKAVNNTYDNWANRNTALSQEMSKVREEINLQQQAYNRYMQEANKVGLSADYVDKIKNGKLDIETIKDEGLINQINSYKEFYEKAIECSDAIQDLKINLGELAEQKFDNVQTEFDAYISTITAYANIIDERINRTEEKGYFVSKNYYSKLMELENQELNNLKSEYTQLSNALNQSIASGAIEKDSQAWHDMNQEILDVQKSIEESTTSLVEYNNAIRDIDWEIFDYILERIDKINTESDFLINAMANMQLYDDTGNFSDYGLTTASLNLTKMQTYIQMAKEYGEEVKSIEKELANDPNSKTLLERREELNELQQEAILNAENEKQAIKSLVEEGINIHLQSLNKLIEKYKETLNSAKDLYDYQNSISEQTQEIDRLKKILISYEGNDSEEARKSIQDYQNQLNDAQKQLKETEWDRYISETQTLLDTLYTDYEETLNVRLDNIDALIETVANSTIEGFDTVKTTLVETSEKLGYEISEVLNSIYNTDEIGGLFSPYFVDIATDFDSLSQNITNGSNGVINAINAIKVVIEKMYSNSSVDTDTSVLKLQNLENGNNNNNNNITTNKNTSTTSTASKNTSSNKTNANTTPQGDGKANKGDKVTFTSGKYYEDSYGNGRSGSWYRGEEVYITAINSKGTYPYHISKGSKIGSQDLGWVKLEQLKGYRVGSKRIDKDQLALVAEEGQELRLNSNTGNLELLGEGDMIFTNEMTQKLWEFAKGNVPTINTSYKPPNLSSTNNAKTINNENSISITLPNVTNYDEFKSKLQKDTRFIGFVQQATFGDALKKNSLTKTKY